MYTTKDKYRKIKDSAYLNDNLNSRNDKNHKEFNSRIHKNKNKKKTKRILKKFLTVIIFILIIFITFFIIRMNENGWTYGGFIATLLGHNSKTLDNLETIYVVVTGESQNLTDSIMLCAFNPRTKKASIMSIPRDTYTGSNQKKATASDKINTLYQKSPEKLIEEVNEITGLNVKYYINIDTNGLKDLIDAIGGVYFDVPIDMDYDDPTQDLHIHLKAGYQLLDGNKSEQVLRFRHNSDGTTYPSSYGDNDIGRMRTQREFIKVMSKQMINKNLLKNSKQYIEIVKENVSTNFNLDLIKDYLPYIIDFNIDDLQTSTLPGEPKKCNGVWLYIVKEKEKDETINNIFKSLEDNSNEVNNEHTEEIQVNITNEEINIELLNGTSNSESFRKAKKSLENAGYNVTKTGVTNTVTKTSIINRTDGATGAANQIKEVLGVGTITSGNTADSIDFTIIIGKDF